MSNEIPLPPFKAFLASNIPSVYDNTLSYYDELTKLIAYLDEIVPVVNANTAGLKALKEYVDNYFSNLNVQEEINNKLDDMASSGQLATIIAQFLAAAPVFGYDTISQMSSATNLANGCIARVLGNTNAADGDGAFYKVRTKNPGESADGIQKVAIGDTLIADRIAYYTPERKYLFIGDSYGTGHNELQEQTTPWTTLVPQYLGLTVGTNCWTNSSDGSGFNNGYTFIAQLHDLADTVPNPNEITDIVIVGGYNDRYYTESVIDGKMSDCFTYAKTAFPNAQIMLACVGWSKVYDVRQTIALNTIPAYQKCGKYGVKYLLNTEYILHDYSLFSGDYYHPNQDGQNALSAYLATAILNGGCTVDRWFSTNLLVKLEDTDTLTPTYAVEVQHNGRIDLMVDAGFMIRSTAATLGNDTTVPLFALNDSGLIMGSGINIFTEYTEIYVAQSGDDNQAEVRGDISPMYDPTNHRCIINFITDKRTTTNTDIVQYNLSRFHLSLPALYC